jgi:cell division protein FtsB
MGQVVVTVALGLSVLAALGLTAWWLGRLIKREIDTLLELAEEHHKRLAVASAELHFARKDVSRLQNELSAVRQELEGFVHGPPSMRRPRA